MAAVARTGRAAPVPPLNISISSGGSVNRMAQRPVAESPAHSITGPVKSAITTLTDSLYEADYVTVPKAADLDFSPEELRSELAKLRAQMRKAAEDLDFERAAELRDRIKSLEEGSLLAGYESEPQAASAPSTSRIDGRRR